MGTLSGHSKSVRSVCFSPAGRHILSAAMDGSVRLWAADTFEQLGQFAGHTGVVNRGVFSPDGGTIVTVSEDCKINGSEKDIRREREREGERYREEKGYGTLKNFLIRTID